MPVVVEVVIEDDVELEEEEGEEDALEGGVATRSLEEDNVLADLAKEMRLGFEGGGIASASSSSDWAVAAADSSEVTLVFSSPLCCGSAEGAGEDG